MCSPEIEILRSLMGKIQPYPVSKRVSNELLKFKMPCRSSLAYFFFHFTNLIRHFFNAIYFSLFFLKKIGHEKSKTCLNTRRDYVIQFFSSLASEKSKLTKGQNTHIKLQNLSKIEKNIRTQIYSDLHLEIIFPPEPSTPPGYDFPWV